MRLRPVAVTGAPPVAGVVSEHTACSRIDLFDAVLDKREKSRQGADEF